MEYRAGRACLSPPGIPTDRSIHAAAHNRWRYSGRYRKLVCEVTLRDDRRSHSFIFVVRCSIGYNFDNPCCGRTATQTSDSMRFIALMSGIRAGYKTTQRGSKAEAMPNRASGRGHGVRPCQGRVQSTSLNDKWVSYSPC